jgi:cell division septation protein DedD
MRLALRQPADPNATKILITPLEEKDLSEDILLRLAKRRLFAVDSWQIVRSLFAAHAVDPRLTKSAWIADMLLDLVPAEGYPAARGGFLDADTAWPLLLRHTIGLASETPDLTALLKWSLDGEATARFRLSAKAFQLGATQWLAEKAGPVAEAVLGCVARLDRPDAVPLGLAAGVVCHPAAAGKLEKATGKLEERFLGGKSPDASLMQRWSTAATEVVRALRFTDPKAHRQTLQRTDEILSEVQGDGFAYLSDVSPIGFDQRLTRFGQRLSSVLESLEKGSGAFCRNGPEGAAHKRLLTPFPDDLDALKEARQSVRDHDQSARETRRLERADMAVRLVRWLKESVVSGPLSVAENHGQRTTDNGQVTNPRSFADAAHAHLRDGGFVDWARLSLRSGDPVQGLSETYARLFDAVTKLREQQAKRFAQLLADWTEAGSQSDEVIPIERVLEQIVGPLAAENPVLVIVIDGMSVAVCRELLSDLTRHEWMAICEPGRNFNRPAVATLPSVTEFSRTSLLCGRLQGGAANDERAGFAEHPTLLARCRTGSPPLLFHRATLQEAEDALLSADVRHEIGSAHRKIVGVVVNAVDDHLLKGGQIDTRWSRDEIKVLPALLHEARTARRLVVLLADHGHVLDCQTQARPCDGGERWRVAGGDTAPDELLVQGQRVLVEGHRLIAPWSERVRYGSMKNGYHGGLSPQEMVVPIAVLSSIDSLPAGWHEQPVDTPAWWDEPASVVAAPQQPAPVLKPKQRPPGALFDLQGEEPTQTAAKAEETPPEWVSRLLTSPIFEEQKRLGGRGLPADDVFAKLLGTLDRRGGKLTSVALARALAFPALRLSGLLAKAQRVLNIDGYAVLSRDDASDTVELNRELLLKQFDLV